MSATGFADTKPLLPASDPRSVGANRRVEIVVIARVDDAAGRAVAELGNKTAEAATVAAASKATASKASASSTTESTSHDDGH
jgi:chemotaxis protein MotB